MFTAATPRNVLGSLAPISSANGSDGIDTSYRFDVYPIHAAPHGTNAVYLFSKAQGGQFVPLYIGKAENLRSRLIGHERMAEALRLGATHLLTHKPGYGDKVHYLEAERRLIAHYNPVLNVQHRTLF